MINKIIIFFLIILSSNVSANKPIYDNVDFLYYIQLEIATCVSNFKLITNQSSKHNLFLNECERIVVNSNKLGKIDFLYKSKESEELNKKIELCSEKKIVREFLRCVYGKSN